MKKKLLYKILVCLIFVMGCSPETVYESQFAPRIEQDIPFKDVPLTGTKTDTINLDTFNHSPTEWGENVTGVKTTFVTKQKEIALTFDACGGEHGSAIDEELITFLKAEQIPATLFINYRWIIENEAFFLDLATDPLFQIENHGTSHAPLSVNGGEAWGIAGTNSPEEVLDEIMTNHYKVKELTNKNMTLFRSGTAFYDEVAVEIATELGYQVVNFDVLGDAGATFSIEQVKHALLTAQNGSIVLLHMNQPKSDTAEGVKAAVPLLKELGFKFILLENKRLD